MRVTLKAARVNKGLKLDEVTEKTGFAKTTLMSWEKEEVYPRIDQLSTLCGVYDCSPADIIFPSITT